MTEKKVMTEETPVKDKLCITGCETIIMSAERSNLSRYLRSIPRTTMGSKYVNVLKYSLN